MNHHQPNLTLPLIPSLLYNLAANPTNLSESIPSHHKASKAISLDEMIIAVVTVPPVTGVAPRSASSKHAVGRSAGPFTWRVFFGGMTWPEKSSVKVSVGICRYVGFSDSMGLLKTADCHESYVYITYICIYMYSIHIYIL